MEQHADQPDAKTWARDFSAMIGRNLREYRTRLGLSAQKLSDATVELGYPIPRSTIANMEGGRKESISIQEVSVLAEALKMPLAAVMYSPLHASEDVRPVPTQTVPTYAAFRLVSDAHLGISGNVSEIAGAQRAVYKTAWQRNRLMSLHDELGKARADLKAIEHGSLTITPNGAHQVPPSEEEVRLAQKRIELLERYISDLEDWDERNVRRLKHFGVEPWPLEEHVVVDLAIETDDA